jgi:capsular polysaccharide transport system permease protein
MVDARINSETGISTLKVAAFRADDAHAIAVAILNYAEDLINRLNERAYTDAERYAQTMVDKERERVRELESGLTIYRNAKGTVDPGKEALASFEMLGKMTTELTMLMAEVQQQTAVAPADPNLPALRERIRSYQTQIDRQKLAIVGSDKSLASKLADYEKLELERELSARGLGLAMINLAKAREDASQQHLYLQTIVGPNMADEPDHMGPIMGMVIVLLISLALFTIARTLGAITLEHAA